ncbi:hypothetical protein M9H77_28478 [Catharanthus roseus]|uniref:Uncharacterized protein n=1 Tax=Catharanthus roseus TaxID=4058 RepID=A0ACC0AH43_CATRO|nr:hypothetical protein M9H77_28478 [Catharanthus roseus]
MSSIVGTVPAYNLQTLTDESCWELIKQRASSNRNFNKNKCKGLPLAAKTLGGLLHFKSSEEEWVSILQSELWNLPLEKSELFPALILSYYYLLAHLRRCFAYCSIFPRNYEFEMGELVLMWIAEGFIHPPQGETRLEDIGCDCYKELMWRSFFQF